MRVVMALAGVVGAVTVALLLPAAGATRAIKDGGTFNVAVVAGRVDTIDPALVNFAPEFQLLAPACAVLMAYPDKPPPAGFRLAPSLAEDEPVVSQDGRSYTFTIRKDARFSDGAPVTARAFAHALERVLDPAMKSDDVEVFEDIVGAQDVIAGKATTARGIVAKGRTLILRLAKRVPDLPGRLASLCAVPPNLPADPEGAKAPLPSPAPYYVSEYLPGERIVLERNRFYRGERPQHVATFVADLTIDFGAALDAVASGTFDTAVPQAGINVRSAQFAQRYGVNKSQFFVAPGAGIRVYHLNTSRPLFRNNVQLRQAVNFIVDRTALAREDGFLSSTPTDQYLQPGAPGYRNERIYPLKGPDVRRARALARGHTRSGKALLYTTDLPSDVAQAQILQQNLRQIGIELAIKQFPVPAYFALDFSKEPYDLLRLVWTFGPDPTVLNCLFDGRTIGTSNSCNLSFFDSPKYNRLLDRASRLTGEERYRAYGELDVQLSRDAAPALPVADANALSFVSGRVGCVVVHPNLDLTAVCLK